MATFNEHQPVWCPLVTQQFRLRDVSKITGSNIKVALSSVVYYTLHQSPDAKAFFTSHKVQPTVGPIPTLEWTEIASNAQLTRLSSLSGVCVRVWVEQPCNAPQQTKATETESDNNVELLFTCGVNFSGLMPISNEQALNLKLNSLIFHTSVGFRFVAADRIDHLVYHVDPLAGIGNGQESFISTASVASEENTEIESVSSRTSMSSAVNRDALVRYVALERLNHEIKSGCSVEQLLALQQRQLRLKYKREILAELVADIQSKSSYCLDMTQSGGVSQQPHTNHRHRNNSGSYSTQSSSMGKTLTRLLNMDRERLDPKQILAALKLRKAIEAAEFRSRLLTDEWNRTKMYIGRLEAFVIMYRDKNIDMDSMIMSKYHAMSKEKTHYLHLKLTKAEQAETLATVREHLMARRQILLRELDDIFRIQERRGEYSIISILLPDSESLTSNIDAPALSAALGYVAHVVLICSSIIGVPLRNPIRFEGSQSKIKDSIKVLNRSERIFPLYSRVVPPPDVTQYAIYLLNQNIAQLQFELGIVRQDLRATLANLMTLTSKCQLNDAELLPPPHKSFNSTTITTPNLVTASNSGVDFDNGPHNPS